MSVLQQGVDHTQLLIDLLNKCNDHEGQFVNQGSYGIGVSFKIADSETSPIMSYTLDNRATTGAELDGQVRTIFVKFVPIFSPPSFEDIERASGQLDWTNTTMRIVDPNNPNEYEYATGVRGPITRDKIKVKHNRTILEIPYENILGYDWDITANTRFDDVGASPERFFMKECMSQVEIYKKTNDNLDSFVPGLYVADTIGKDKTDILDLLERKFHRGNSSMSSVFFSKLKTIITNDSNFTRKGRKLGVMVMPSMPIPPITMGGTLYKQFNCFTRTIQLSKFFDIRRFSHKVGNNNIIKKYDDIHDVDSKRALFYLVQLVANMLNLLDLGWIHGDLHLNNTMINPNQSCTTQCFVRDANGALQLNGYSPFMGKAFVIDYGTAVKLDPVPTYDGLTPYEKFKIQIEIIMGESGSHGFGPLDYPSYDWFPSLFMERKANGNYKDSSIQSSLCDENLLTMFDLIEEFKEKRAEYQSMIIDSMKSDTLFGNEFQSLLERVRRINRDSNYHSIFGITRGGAKMGKKNEYKRRSLSNNIVNSSLRRQSKSNNMETELVREIFRYDLNTMKTVGEKMIENIQTGIDSVNQIRQNIEVNKDAKKTTRSRSISVSRRRRRSKTGTRSKRSRSK